MLLQSDPTASLPFRARRFRLLALVSLLGSILLPVTVSANLLTSSASSFTGDPLSVMLEIDDAAGDPGDLIFTLSVDGGGIGDLRGLFLNVSDESLLSGLDVSGSAITQSIFDANNVINLGGGSNLNGGGSPCPCDIGLEIGSPGIGSDDLQSIMFTLSHASMDLSLSLFAGQDFGVRATSVGDWPGSREGSSKLTGIVPVPEPTTTLLMMLGLTGLASMRRSSQP